MQGSTLDNNSLLIRRFRYMVGAIVMIIMVSLMIKMLIPLYDMDEAKLAAGDVYDVSSGWTVKYADGSESVLDFPCEIPAENSAHLTLSHPYITEYGGLSLTFFAENAAVSFSINGRPVYDSGTMGRRSPGGNEFMIPEGPGNKDGLKNTVPNDSDVLDKASEEVVEAGDLVMDIPTGLSDGEMKLELLQAARQKSIYVHGPYISKRDIKVVTLLEKSLIPIVCAILVILMSVIIVSMDVMRRISGQGGVLILPLLFLSLSAVGFIILQSGLLCIFFSNRLFFDNALAVNMIFVPMVLSFFYYRRFRFIFPILPVALLWITTIGTILILLIALNQGKIELLEKYYIEITYGLTGLGILILLFMTFFKKRDVFRRYKIIIDFAGFFCLFISACLALDGTMSRHSNFREYSIDILVVLAFFLMTIQSTLFSVSEYREKVEKNSRLLEKQVKIAEEAKADAIAANEAKGVFLANMSHEIRTPINAVLGMDEMILRESREKHIRDYAMDIHTAGLSLLAIINDILDISKIESGKLEIVPVNYDLSSVIHDLTNMIMLRAQKKKLEFKVSVEKELPSRLFGDDVRLKQVITNILTNAVKYTEKGTVWMRISGTREGEDEILHVEVEDTGIGIKKEDMGKLFEAFQRIEEKRNRNIEGTGLGINITMHLLNMMGSKLMVESEYGKGSRFFFDVRQKIMSEVPIGDFEERIKLLGEEYTYTRRFVAPDARVLVVDDNSMNRKVFTSLLRPTKIQVTEAEGGKKAVELAASEHFDIIFMDHMMPEMDGVEALHKIRELTDYPCKDTPIYVLTANAVAGAKEQYLKEGFDGFLSKPVVGSKLEEAIKEELPKNLLLPGTDEEDDLELKEGTDNDFLDELPMVDGLDWQFAFLHLPGKEMLESALKEFYGLIKLHGDKLEMMKKGLPEQRDAYRIQVHGMKSAAASIGIIPLAGMAKMLEFAARDGDYIRINSLHDIFVSEWMSYTEKLKGVMGLGEEELSEKEEVDTGALSALLDIIKGAMEDMDVDTADESVEKLSGFVLPEDMEKELPELKAMVADLDSEGAAEVAERMQKVLGNIGEC